VPCTVDVTAPFAGQEPGAVDWSAAADLVHGAIEPDGDIHATAAYRAMLAVELSRRTLASAAAASLSHAKGESAPHDPAPTRLLHESAPGGAA
jgi:carbon-monoxide dehydrogenase medium subunit